MVYGSSIPTRTVTLVNNGHSPVSFTIPHSALEGSGFSVVMMEKVRSLPPEETLDIEVTFDPTLIKLTEGKAKAPLHFNVSRFLKA